MKKPRLPEHILNLCRTMRRTSTDAETRFWRCLRGRQLSGAKFRRQHPIGPYILDLYCHDAELAVEVDGGGHAEETQKERDVERTEYLEAHRIRVLRFWNNQVLANTEGVLEVIANALAARRTDTPLPSGESPPSPSGRGLGRGSG